MQEDRVFLPQYHKDRIQQLGHLAQDKRLDPESDSTVAIQRLRCPAQHLGRSGGGRKGRRREGMTKTSNNLAL